MIKRDLKLLEEKNDELDESTINNEDVEDNSNINGLKVEIKTKLSNKIKQTFNNGRNNDLRQNGSSKMKASTKKSVSATTSPPTSPGGTRKTINLNQSLDENLNRSSILESQCEPEELK